jgi:uncharacterized protein (DUF4415 family)
VQAIGGKEKKNMKNKVNKNRPIWDKDGYEEAPTDINKAIGAGARVKLEDLLPKPKERINIMIDKPVVDFFKKQAKQRGGKYQTMMNGVLSDYVSRQ